MKIDKELIEDLLARAKENPRLRQNSDLRTSPDDSSQRMLNALLPGTSVPIHRHPLSNETIILLSGRVDEVFYDGKGNEIERILLDPSRGKFGVWYLKECGTQWMFWSTLFCLKRRMVATARMAVKLFRSIEDGLSRLRAFKIGPPHDFFSSVQK